MTLLQNIEFGLQEFEKNQARQQAVRMLSRVGLADRSDEYPHMLSGGEQQRVALARALAPKPGILLMDEPFSGLDSRLRDTIRDQSLELLRETRSTAIIVTHDAEEALRVGDHIALIRDGNLVQHGTGKELYYNPKNLFAAGFFSEVNAFPASVENGIAVTPFGSAPAPGCEGSNCYAAVRHTDVEVIAYEEGQTARMGRILDRRFLGTSEILDIAIDGFEVPLNARVRPGLIEPNAVTVGVQVDPKLIMIFPSSEI